MTDRMMVSLKAAMAADPKPERTTYASTRVSAAVRKNRVRIGLPEQPTAKELREWSRPRPPRSSTDTAG